MTENMPYGFNEQEMNSSLLRYYTDLANHHRVKITFFIGIFFTLSQLIILTPIKVVEGLRDLQSVDASRVHVVAAAATASVLLLLLIGIGHHICNFVAANTCRIRHETYHVKDLLDSTNGTLDIDIERHVRHNFPLSRITGPAAFALGFLLYVLTIFGYVHIIQTFLAKSSQTYISGTIILFIALNVAALVFFGYQMKLRLNQFRVAQGVLAHTRDLSEEFQIREFLQKKGVSLNSSM